MSTQVALPPGRSANFLARADGGRGQQEHPLSVLYGRSRASEMQPPRGSDEGGSGRVFEGRSRRTSCVCDDCITSECETAWITGDFHE